MKLSDNKSIRCRRYCGLNAEFRRNFYSSSSAAKPYFIFEEQISVEFFKLDIVKLNGT